LGYSLLPNQQGLKENKNAWDLYIRHEEVGPKIYTYCLTPKDEIAFNEMIEKAIAKYDEQILKHPETEGYKIQKKIFLQLFPGLEEK
jgi:hypothetical protein